MDQLGKTLWILLELCLLSAAGGTLLNEANFVSYRVPCDADLRAATQLPSTSDVQCKVLCVRHKCLAFHFDAGLQTCFLFDHNGLNVISSSINVGNMSFINVVNIGSGRL